MNAPTQDVEQTLQRSRPVPHPAFRGELRRRLMDRPPAGKPVGLRGLIVAYGGSGALLLLVAAAGVAGIGPLAA